MKNDLFFRVYRLWSQKNHEIYFDYYLITGKLVGSIMVDSKGKIKWDIYNPLYEDNIFYVINILTDNKGPRFLSYESNDWDRARWERTKKMIINRGLYYSEYKEKDNRYIKKKGYIYKRR